MLSSPTQNYPPPNVSCARLRNPAVGIPESPLSLTLVFLRVTVRTRWADIYIRFPAQRRLFQVVCFLLVCVPPIKATIRGEKNKNVPGHCFLDSPLTTHRSLLCRISQNMPSRKQATTSFCVTVSLPVSFWSFLQHHTLLLVSSSSNHTKAHAGRETTEQRFYESDVGSRVKKTCQSPSPWGKASPFPT